MLFSIVLYIVPSKEQLNAKNSRKNMTMLDIFLV